MPTATTELEAEPYTPNELKTPGQVAYEAWCVAMDHTPYWNGVDQKAWDGIASAVIAHNNETFKP